MQALVQLEPAVKAVEEKITSQQSSIEQRLKWAAGANPGLNPVLKEFDKTVEDRKQMLKVGYSRRYYRCIVLYCDVFLLWCGVVFGVMYGVMYGVV